MTDIIYTTGRASLLYRPRISPLPELRRETPRQGGSDYCQFPVYSEVGFLRAARYVGLTARERERIEAQARKEGLL